MRIRSLVVWFVVPLLVLVTTSCWAMTRAASVERDVAARMARQALRSQVVTESLTAMSSEIMALIALDAFDVVPSQLAIFDIEQSMTRTEYLAQLATAENMAAPAGDRLAAIGPVPDPVRMVLAPTDPQLHQRLEQGETELVDGDMYARAYAWITTEFAGAGTRSTDAINSLLRLEERAPYWKSLEFLGFACALLFAALSGMVMMLWRVAHAARELDDQAKEAKRDAERAWSRAEHMRRLIGTARELAGDDNAGEVAQSLASEMKQLLGSDIVVLAMLRNGELWPMVADGSVPAVAVPFGSGVAGRAAETGTVVRMVVTSDPMFPSATSSMSLLAAPMVHDGHVVGVLVAGSPSTELLGDDDETVLSLVALVGAGAFRSAQRFGSALELTLRDPLTGLGNRRRLDRDLGGDGDRGNDDRGNDDRGNEDRLHDGPTAALMIDIDHFKSFNDRFGHAAGDDALRAVGAAIAGAIRSNDVAYRFGGEEFSVLLPDAEAPTAMLVAERIRTAVADVPTPSGCGPITVSIGVAMRVRNGEPSAEQSGEGAESSPALIEAADKALYDAKRSGRDRVRLHESMDVVRS
jgi:diguanylate cyclase (GGDEF)-like protein